MNFWKQLRAFLGCPVIEVGQTWQCVSWSGDPFEEKIVTHFHILEIREGYVRGRYDNGDTGSFSFHTLRFMYGLPQ